MCLERPCGKQPVDQDGIGCVSTFCDDGALFGSSGKPVPLRYMPRLRGIKTFEAECVTVELWRAIGAEQKVDRHDLLERQATWNPNHCAFGDFGSLCVTVGLWLSRLQGLASTQSVTVDCCRSDYLSEKRLAWIRLFQAWSPSRFCTDVHWLTMISSRSNRRKRHSPTVTVAFALLKRYR